jgi:hypothetical protein
MKSIPIDLIGCKYRPIAKLLQHKEARIVVASALRHGEKNTQVVKDKAESVRAKLATDNFVSHAERRADARVATRINAVDIVVGAPNLINCPDFNYGAITVTVDFNSTQTELR